MENLKKAIEEVRKIHTVNLADNLTPYGKAVGVLLSFCQAGVEATGKLDPYDSYQAVAVVARLIQEKNKLEDYNGILQSTLASKEERIRQLSHSNTARRVEMQQEVIEKLEAELARVQRSNDSCVTALENTSKELARVREETKDEVVNYWFCATCKRRLELKEVTFEETCVNCGGYVKWIEARLKERKG